MATAGDIVVNLTANSAQFTSGINKAKSDLSGLASSLNSIKQLIGGFLAVHTITHAFSEIKESLGQLTEVGAVAKTIGASTEFVSELGFAAKMSHVSVEDLTNGFKKMEKTIGQAAMGNNDGLVKMLSRANLEAGKLQKMGPEDAFMEIAEAASRIKDPMQRAAFAVEIFGKGGQALIPLLAKGKDGIEELREEAQKLGVSFSSDMTDKASEAMHALKKVDAVMQGLKVRLAIDLAPGIASAADAFVELVKMATPLIDVFTGIVGIFKEFKDNLEEIGLVISSIAVGESRKETEALLQGLQGKRRMDAIIRNANRFNGPGAADDLDLGGQTISKQQKGNPPIDIFSKEGFSIIAQAAQTRAVNVNQQQLIELKEINKGVGKVEQGLKNIKLPPVGPGK